MGQYNSFEKTSQGVKVQIQGFFKIFLQAIQLKAPPCKRWLKGQFITDYKLLWPEKSVWVLNLSPVRQLARPLWRHCIQWGKELLMWQTPSNLLWTNLPNRPTWASPRHCLTSIHPKSGIPPPITDPLQKVEIYNQCMEVYIQSKREGEIVTIVITNTYANPTKLCAISFQAIKGCS